MANPRDIRELALQALYQLDARGGEDEALSEIRSDVPMTDEQRAEAFDLARDAYARREQADAMATELAPNWPTNRQPMIDRNLIRLCWCEMTTGHAPAKVAVNEAIELAKRYSTEKSPAFVNGVLDKMMKRLPTPAPEVDGRGRAEPTTGDAWLNDAMATQRADGRGQKTE